MERDGTAWKSILHDSQEKNVGRWNPGTFDHVWWVSIFPTVSRQKTGTPFPWLSLREASARSARVSDAMTMADGGCWITAVPELESRCWIPVHHIWLFYLPYGNFRLRWKITTFNGKIHYRWPFSIATLNYQRVSILYLTILKQWSNGAIENRGTTQEAPGFSEFMLKVPFLGSPIFRHENSHGYCATHQDTSSGRSILAFCFLLHNWHSSGVCWKPLTQKPSELIDSKGFLHGDSLWSHFQFCICIYIYIYLYTLYIYIYDMLLSTTI